MKRYILTGTPGSGKTSILRALKHQGYAVVEEAATDIIALEQREGNLEPSPGLSPFSPPFRRSGARLEHTGQMLILGW